MPLAYAEAEFQLIKDMENQGIIRKSNSPWASPLNLVMKKNGKVRPCIDYRKVNDVTKNDAFPLPRIQDCLDAVSGASIFSTFDLTSGYHQVPVKEADIPKTAFITKYGLWEFLTMPMGMKGSAQTFQRTLQIILNGLQWQTCLIYLDDIIVFGSTFDEHLKRVQEVLRCIQQAGLKLKPKKCQLFQQEVTFLGHVVNKDGVKPNPENVSKILNWPIPRNVTEVRQILGMASYYRKFVKDFAAIARPLIQLTKKDIPFEWTDDCDTSFSKIKECLTGPDIMAFPMTNEEFILDTDASNYSIGAVLSQMQNGQERVISYASRTMNKAETNYCVTDKELLVVKYFIEYFQQYLLGRKFRVRTDHQALVWLFKIKEPKGHVARWIEILSAYDFSIEYRPGPKHGNADALSRCPDPHSCQCHTDTALKCGPCKKCIKRDEEPPQKKRWCNTHSDRKDDIRAVTRNQIHTEFTTWHDVCKSVNMPKLQQSDPDLELLYKAKKEGQQPDEKQLKDTSPACRYYFNVEHSILLKDDILFKEFISKDGNYTYLQLLLPRSLRNEVLQQMHDSLISGHLGIKKDHCKDKEIVSLV